MMTTRQRKFIDLRGQMERRASKRIAAPFSAMVRAVDKTNEVFKTKTFLNNLSRSGLSMRVGRPVKEGTKILVVIQLSTALQNDQRAPRVAVRGEVLRAEPQSDGTCSVAVSFTHRRFL